jgi:hypothetical protein
VTSCRSYYVSTIGAASPEDRKCPTTITLVNSGHVQTVWTSANKNFITAAVKEEQWRISCDIMSGVSQPTVLKVLCNDELQPYNPPWGVYNWFAKIILYGCRFVNCYNIHTVRMSSFYTNICGHTKYIYV